MRFLHAKGKGRLGINPEKEERGVSTAGLTKIKMPKSVPLINAAVDPQLVPTVNRMKLRLIIEL